MATSNSSPVSLSYPNMGVFPRSFRAILPATTLLSSVIFYEFRGWGILPTDVCLPGDIYLDLMLPYILYVCNTNGWEAWNPEASLGSQLLARHPSFPDIYLWPRRGGMWWGTKTELGLDPKVEYSMDGEMQNTLFMLATYWPDSSWSRFELGAAENEKRRDAELERRNLNHVVVSKTPTLHGITELRQKQLREKRKKGNQGSVLVTVKAVLTHS
ncbi:hypothetical protein DFH07DRAFT_771731 [Mycena maculata]|uniref:Uncharacterized protein n=1 Tax=Mycena maculata TaxID=230809 RepID=A0AAD7JAW7_9AGAR|nr:hypothetical protein DFH07DRAFT_771731 [Mycena maculata]